MERPDALLDCTPVEIGRILRAHAVRERAGMERLDAAAWLTGRYAARALGDPRRYPARPDGLVRPPMSPEGMKSVFAAMAARGRNDQEE